MLSNISIIDILLYYVIPANYDVYTILSLLIILGLVIWFFRIKNFELSIKNNTIFHKNIFGIKKEYNVSEIKYYKEISIGEYYNSKGNKISGSISIMLRLNKKRIWLFSGDSNLNELLNYLDNNITSKKTIL